jgi:serine/threonine protein kinase
MEEKVGKYLLRSELGRGASSIVYLAYDEFLNADLALKVYLPESTAERAMTADVQFVSEAALAGRLEHPHIVTIVDAVAEPGRRYVAMEYVAGGSLLRYSTPGRLLPVADLAQIAFKCCGALDYASRLGIVHRDIKPSNILLDGAGDMKLADFGAAFVRGVRTTERFKLSSPSYTPPEQIREQPPSAQGDMFSLGVTLYELLTGVKPFRGETVEARLQSILEHRPVPPSQLRPELPPLFDGILDRLLRKWPEERYANWAEAALDLASVGRLSIYEMAVPDSEKFTALRASSLTCDFDDVEAWDAVRHGRWRWLRAQEVVVREGDAGDSLLLVARGEAAVMTQGRMLNVLRTGDCFGEMAYAQGSEGRRSATVQTLTDTLIAEFTPALIAQLSPGTQLKLARTLLRVLAERLTFANARLAKGG